MTTIEKIKAEIERRITDNTFGAKLELIDILAWLDTLESEKMIQDGLDEEYKDYVENDPVYSKLVNRNAGLDIARHFAQWGAEHLKK